MMNNDRLRAEITELKGESRTVSCFSTQEPLASAVGASVGHPLPQDEEIRLLMERLAVNQVELELAEKHIVTFSEETIDLMLQVVAATNDLQVRRFDHSFRFSFMR